MSAPVLPFGAPPPWIIAAALATTALLATATAVSLWLGQRGRRAVRARLARPGTRDVRALADVGAADAFAITEVEGWRGALLVWLARWLPRSARSAAAADALASAGYFQPAALLYFGGARLAAPVLLPALAFALTGGAVPLAVGLALLVGLVGPSALLDRKAGARRAGLVTAIPDALDLLIVCLEAGVGVDAALVRVARELAPTHPVLAAELENVTRRISAGLPREEALRALVSRTRVEDLRAIVSTMIQAERLGTSLARVLRIHGEALRARRRQTAEKKAAEASVKMLLPLVIFLLPAFFTVVLGPAVLSMMGTMGTP